MNIFKYFPFYFRKRFKQKFIIIESDDWGLTGAINKDGISYMKKNYGNQNFSRWTTDSLETVDDISLIYELLYDFKNSFKRPPVITANFITHNINYNDHSRLSFLPLSQYLNKNKKLKKIYLDGIDNGMLYPQLHGYCHYDIEKLELFFNTVEGRDLFRHGFLNGKSTIKGHLSDFRSELTDQNKKNR